MAITTYFISDLHLSEENEALNDAFFTFLDLIKPHAKRLIINGDFFNAWWGPSLVKTPFAQEIKEGLTALEKGGCSTEFIKGNRDFLLAKDAKHLAMQSHGHAFVFDNEGYRIAVTHGDQFCLDDRGHQFLRLLTQNLPLHLAARIAPNATAQRLAKWLRGRSKAKRKDRPERPMSFYDLKDEPMQRYLAKTRADTLICGHIHQPQERHLVVAGEQKRVLVLSDWNSSGAIIAGAEDGQAPELLEFRHGEIKPWQHPIRANAKLSSGDRT